MKILRFFSLIVLTASLSFLIDNLAANSQLNPDTYLEINDVQGRVSVTIGGETRSAEIGDRIFMKDKIETKGKSKVTLTTKTKTIEITENSAVVVDQANTKNNISVIRLNLLRGRIGSKGKGSSGPFIITTGSGTVVVRNTEFGVTLDSSGKMGVATKEGDVLTTGNQGNGVMVSSGFQNLTLPGESSSQPVKLIDNPDLEVTNISVVTNERKEQKLKIIGKTDSVNLLSIADELQEVSRSGDFTAMAPIIYPDQEIEAVTTTPLGRRKRTKIWSQVCTPLIVVGGSKVDDTVVQKTINPAPFFGANKDTDFIVPANKSFQRFWVKTISKTLDRADISVYLKYRDSAPDQFFSQQSETSSDTKYTLAIPRSENYPEQVNIRIGGPRVWGTSYILSVDGCNDSSSG